MVEIREARIADFEEIYPLFQQLHPKKLLEKPKVFGFFRRMLSSGNNKAWVALENRKIAGYIDVAFGSPHTQFEFNALVETTVVDKDHRGRGIGTQLLKRCEEEMKNRGYGIIEMDSAFEREEAHQFYEENGYKKRGILFWKKL